MLIDFSKRSFDPRYLLDGTERRFVASFPLGSMRLMGVMSIGSMTTCVP